jgi:hypothetical protein
MIVQPVLVEDDGEELREIQVEPTQVSASDWPNYSTEGWPAALKQLEEQVESAE